MYDNFGMYTQRFSTLRLIEIGPPLSRKVIYSAGDSSNERKKEQSLLCEESRTVENGVRNRENKPIISTVISLTFTRISVLFTSPHSLTTTMEGNNSLLSNPATVIQRD